MVESFREKLRASPSKSIYLGRPGLVSSSTRSNLVLFIEVSTTPPGSPPPNVVASIQGSAPALAPTPAPAPAAPPARDSQSILNALANLARQSTPAAPSASSVPAPAASYNVPAAATGLPQPVSSVSQPRAQPPQPQPPVSYPPSTQPAMNLPFSLPQMPGPNGLPGAVPNAAPPFPAVPGVPGNPVIDSQQQQQIALIKALADSGVPFDKIPTLLQSLSGVAGAAGAVASAGSQAQVPPVPAPQNSYAQGQPSWGAPGPQHDEPPRDWRGYNDRGNSRGYGSRSRSKSPDRGWGRRGSPREGRDRRDHGRDSPTRGRDDRNGRRGGEYRDRSPGRRRGQSPSPTEKWTDFDPTLPTGHIKVLSRTLFVGGVT
jgi:protein NRD1